MKAPDHEQKLHLGGTAKPGIQKTLDWYSDFRNLRCRPRQRSNLDDEYGVAIISIVDVNRGVVAFFSIDASGRRPRRYIVLISLHRFFRCRLERVLSRRLAGLNPTGKTLAKHADRTEFHRSRKLITEALAGALGLFAHGSNRPSVATSACSNTTLAPSGAKLASTAPGKLLSRCTSNRVLRYSTALNYVSEQNSCPLASCAAHVDNELRR